MAKKQRATIFCCSPFGLLPTPILHAIFEIAGTCDTFALLPHVCRLWRQEARTVLATTRAINTKLRYDDKTICDYHFPSEFLELLPRVEIPLTLFGDQLLYVDEENFAENLRRLLFFCPNLQELKIGANFGNYAYKHITGLSQYYDSAPVQPFMSIQFAKLAKLEIEGDCPPETLHDIATHCPALEELTCFYDDDDYPRYEGRTHLNLDIAAMKALKNNCSKLRSLPELRVSQDNSPGPSTYLEWAYQDKTVREFFDLLRDWPSIQTEVHLLLDTANMVQLGKEFNSNCGSFNGELHIQYSYKSEEISPSVYDPRLHFANVFEDILHPQMMATRGTADVWLNSEGEFVDAQTLQTETSGGRRHAEGIFVHFFIWHIPD
jgi:hypothetical protein